MPRSVQERMQTTYPEREDDVQKHMRRVTAFSRSAGYSRRDNGNPDFSIDLAIVVAPTKGGAFTFGAANCRAAAVCMHLGLEHNGITGRRIARDLVP